MSTVRAAHARLTGFSWVQLSLLVGGLLTLGWSAWQTQGIDARIVRDGLMFLVIPVALARAYGRELGFRVDRRAILHALVLAAVVLPFYIVGSSLPTIRAYYPMWGLSSTAPAAFIPHAAKQVLIVIAAETYYRGLLCVGVRELGPKSIFISPVVYAIAHAAKPPIEILLSGPTDVLFGAADYRSRSLLPSIVAHGLGLVLLDWLVLHPPLLSPSRVLGWLAWLPVPL
ncbi:MAG: CPBP family intramembrane glutamic endopeptidase [Halobacteriales archaeon]|nr:CPBP family intramembrane glutamic endopeptidase [Halobacteriales archaeon]